MRIVIISGLSGSGKSVALNTLEDDNFFCMDNLPVALLPTFIKQCLEEKQSYYEKIAIGIDSRSGSKNIEQLLENVRQLKSENQQVEILFLTADINAIIKRFSETRRKHPLTTEDVSLIKAIHLERDLLSEIADHADLTIDTTHTNVRQLRALVNKVVVSNDKPKLTIVLQSFGFKHGAPNDSDFMFDVRCLPNPYWNPNLRSLSGHDTAVGDYLDSYPEVNEMVQSIFDFMQKWIPLFEEEDRSYLTLSVGCTGGHHRSVYCINKISQLFSEATDYKTIVRHREFE